MSSLWGSSSGSNNTGTLAIGGHRLAKGEQIRGGSLEHAVPGLGTPSCKATGEREELALVRASPCWWAPIFDVQERGREQVGSAFVVLSIEGL